MSSSTTNAPSSPRMRSAPRDVDVGVVRHEEAAHLAAVGGRAEDQVARHDAVGQDLLLAVDVGEEEVERAQPLGQARLDLRPLRRRNDARKEIGRDDPFGRALGAVDGEGDALQQEGLLERPLAIGQFGRRKRRHPRLQRSVVRADRAVRREHLVVGPARAVEAAGWKQGDSALFSVRHACEAPQRRHSSFHAAFRASRQARLLGGGDHAPCAAGWPHGAQAPLNWAPTRGLTGARPARARERRHDSPGRCGYTGQGAAKGTVC